MINITFPDGAVREFESGVTTFEIAQSISNSLAKNRECRERSSGRRQSS